MEAVRKVHTHLNLGGNEIRDARVEHLSEDPAPSSGRIVFNPETGEFRFSDGKKWFPLKCPWDVDQDGNIVAEGNVIIRGNLVVEQDIASFADGDDTPSIGGGLDIEMLEEYLEKKGNIDKDNITEQRVLSATKLVNNSNIDIVTIDESNFIVLNRAMRASKDAYLLGHIYTDSASNLLLGKDNTGIYLHRTGINWHNENNNWSSSLISFEKTAIKVYSAVRPNSNNLCTLGLSDYRWSNVYSTNGNFNKTVSISSTGGMYVNAMNMDNSALKLTTQLATNAYAPILSIKTSDAHICTLGGIGNKVGFYGFYADRTENGTDWYHYIECYNGLLVHSGDATFGGSLTVNENLFTSTLTSRTGLSITANNEAETARLYLTYGTFRPWSNDSGKIDLGTSTVQWRTVYAINIVASGDVATM